MKTLMICAARLYLTADKSEIVGEDDERKAFLYATPGDHIPESAVERYGIVDGKPPKAKKAGGAKEKDAPPNKEKKPGQDKGGKKGGGKKSGAPDKPTPPTPPALTDIAGIGPATAEALAKAGVNDVQALATVDLANLPTVEGLAPAFDWAASIEAAGKLVAGEPTPAVQGS